MENGHDVGLHFGSTPNEEHAKSPTGQPRSEGVSELLLPHVSVNKKCAAYFERPDN
jgi:hypothetical protein